MTKINFKCDECSKTLKSRKNLDHHMHKKPKTIYCDFCSAVFTNKTGLSHHIDIHRKYSILQCKVCGLKFTTTKILKAHLKGHFQPKICEFCAKAFARSVELNLHIASKHIRDLKFPCTFCSRRFSTRKIQREHETRIHRTIKQTAFKCPECEQSFSMREQLRVHSFEHFSGPVYKCTEDCEKFFKTSQALKLHMRSHSQKKSYQCHRCVKTFVQSSGLGKHLKRCRQVDENELKKVELDVEKVVQVASYQYQEILKAKGRLRRNEVEAKLEDNVEVNLKKEEAFDKADDRMSDTAKESFGGEDVEQELIDDPRSSDLKPYSVASKRIAKHECDFCNSAFNSKRGILLHIRSKHVEKKQTPLTPRKSPSKRELCQFCAKTFKSKWKRQLHEKTSHQQEPVECEICKKRLKHQVCLKEHMKNFHQPGFKRQKPAPVQCSKCWKEFDGKSKLDRHVKNVHEKVSNGREYRCEECKAVFMRQNDLREHSFLHVSSDEVFSCLICGQQFFTLAKLNYHNFTHNPQQVCCIVCRKVFARRASLRKHQINCHLVQSFVLVSQS